MSTITRRTEISVSTAAKMLMVSQMTVLRYLEDGTLAGYQMKERSWWRVYLDSVEALVNARTKGESQ